MMYHDTDEDLSKLVGKDIINTSFIGYAAAPVLRVVVIENGTVYADDLADLDLGPVIAIPLLTVIKDYSVRVPKDSPPVHINCKVNCKVEIDYNTPFIREIDDHMGVLRGGVWRGSS